MFTSFQLVGFLADQKLTSGTLVDAPVVKDVLQTGRESIIDYIHISPIKACFHLHTGTIKFVSSSSNELPDWVSLADARQFLVAWKLSRFSTKCSTQ